MHSCNNLEIVTGSKIREFNTPTCLLFSINGVINDQLNLKWRKEDNINETIRKKNNKTKSTSTPTKSHQSTLHHSSELTYLNTLPITAQYQQQTLI